jgi:hypothetical protein
MRQRSSASHESESWANRRPLEPIVFAVFEGLFSARSLGPLLLADNPRLHSLRHVAKWDPQYVGNSPKTADRRVDDPALDSADVCAVEATIGAEAFLRKAGLIAEFAHDDADGLCLQIGRLDLPLAPLPGQIRWW